MKKILLLAVLLLVQFFEINVFANDKNLSCTPTITTGNISPSTICAGTVINVPFTLTDCVDPGNVFTAQLSDASGSFVTPINIGSASATSSGFIIAIIPPTTTFGSAYRIIVISSSPLTIGTDNGFDLVLLPKPNATFNINNSTQCISNNNYIFTNTSTGSISGYKWNLGDGIFTTLTNVNYSYSGAGNYLVTLTATGTNGCKDSSTQTVIVQSKPVADFSYNGPDLCSSSIINFTNTSTGLGITSTNWNFGDGDTSTSQNPTHTFASVGSYNVKLFVQNVSGCKDSVVKTINVLDKPSANFLINNTLQCLVGNSFTFPNISTGIGNTYLWIFGDGTTSVATNAQKNYTAAGIYSVKLIVTNVNGCKDSISNNITVLESPAVAFSAIGNTLCTTNLNVLFSNNSTGTGNIYNWDFGDGTNATSINPSKTYVSAGAYFVKLLAVNANGCKDSIVNFISVNSKSVSNFTINNNIQCLGNNLFSFTNTTSGIITNSFWSFGDGTTTTLNNPSKSFSNAGDYDVKLIVTNSNGCIDSIVKTVTVVSGPVATFSVNGNTSCSSTLNVNLNNSSTGIGNTYFWNFGDGTNSTQTSPSKTYATASSYIIRLVATNSSGCKDSTERSVTFASKPTATFSVNNSSQCTDNNMFTFTNNSVGGSSYSWNFGDGFTSNAMNPTKQYASAGTYTVKLVVTNASGCKDSLSQVVLVLSKPVADFTISGGTSCSSSLTIQLINLSSGSSPAYSWDFGDGSTSTSTNPSKSYTSSGTYTIKLVVTNGNGCKDSTTLNFTLGTKPVVDFSINNNNQCVNNNVFTFTNTTSGAITYSWSFGDGFTSNAINPTKQYISTGTYTVKLIATSSNGCTDSISKNVTVLPKPNAAFTFTGLTGCTNNRTISFNNTSTGTGNNYSWDFGDGSNSTATNPAITYAAAGTYTIKLVVTNVNGCKDSITQILTFNAFPVAGISLASGTKATQCYNGNSYNFISTANGATNFQWNFGDGTNSSLVNPSKIYSSPGTYVVKEIATSVAGCKDSTTLTVTVLPSPNATFTATYQACNNLNAQFVQTNTTNTTFSAWYFGDGNGPSDVFSTNHTYATSGTYTVKYFAYDATFTCADSATQIITFNPKPNLGIVTTTNTTQCFNGNSFVFADAFATASTYLWRFGDGTTATSLAPAAHSYTSPGTYVVKEIATSVAGCKDSTTLTVTVLPSPNATFTATYQACNNLNAQFVQTNTTNTTFSAWYFGDGNGPSDVFSTNHTYATSGTYTVKYFAYDGTFTCADSATQIITFSVQPNAGITYLSTQSLTQCLNSNNYTFNDNSLGATTYLWSFGDGTISALPNPPSHTYTASGTYTVKQVVTNLSGCKDSTTLTVSVLPSPDAKFQLNYNVCNFSSTFNQINSNNTVTSVWDFGDGSGVNATVGSTINHNYPGPGTYVLKHFATSVNGCVDSAKQIIIADLKPIAGINSGATNLSQCLNSNSFAFVNSSINATSYLWKFGDGTTATEMHPTHTYANAGVYTIKLFASTTSGCIDSTSLVVTVLQSPQAAFITNYNECGLLAQFVQTNSAITAFGIWNFGDGNIVNGGNTQNHTYTSVGSYTVKHFVYNASSTCSDSATQVVTFFATPVSGINSVSSNSQCLNINNFLFTDNSINAVTHSWNFGDGTSSTLANPPSHSYTTSGIYTVKHIAFNSTCKDSTIINVSVLASPNAAFTANYAACNNLTVQLAQTNTANTVSSFWYFGDGNGLNNVTNTSYTYTSTGSYIVKYIAHNSSCSDSSTQTITLNAKPIASISLSNLTTQCLNGNSFLFTDNSSNATTHKWDFGDGTTSTLTNPPAHTYSLAGTYTVKLVVKNTSGCADSTTLTINVIAKPVAAFSTNGTTSCTTNLTISTNNTSTGTGNVYSWDFGDGFTSTVTNPSHTYSAFGTYQIKLVVTNAGGCKDSINQSISISSKPVAAFTITALTQCLTGGTLQLTDASTGALTPSYYYDFGDGTFSTLQNPTKTYSAAGTYIVKQIITNTNGCKDSITQTVVVDIKPNASFNIANFTTCTNTNSVSFVNTSTNATNYIWSFGDGVDSTSKNPTHTYTSIGVYTVKLVAANTSGCKDSTTQTITLASKPLAKFGYFSAGLCNNNTFIFTDSSTISGTNAYYYWDFGDGTFSLLQNPTKAFANTGTYKVILFVTNANGCKDSTSKTIVITSKPTASFTISNYNSCSNNNTLTFVNASTNATSYIWSFGDGVDSTSKNPTHTYPSFGTFIVKLVAMNSSGCRDSATQTINLIAKPTASFKIVSSGACTNNTFSFIDSSIINGTTAYYYWDFGDGTFSLSQNSTKTFATSGTYKVILFVTNANGCKDSTSKFITVVAAPKAAFTLSNFNPCSSNYTITTINNSTNATNYFWDFGDGILTNQTNITRTFAGAGTYTITLIASNSNGCTDTAKQTISYTAKPIAAFNVSSLSGCVSNSFSFSDNSTVSGTPSYYYNFGDGITSSLPNTTHSYSLAGTYKVIYVVTNSNGCKDSTNQTLIVTVKPKASFTTPNTGGCSSNNTFSFTNTSTNASTYIWDFGDGTGATTINATKTYSTIGTYTVKLIATNGGGCSDTTIQTFNIISKPIASFNVSSLSGCVNNSVAFSDNSTVSGVATYYYDFGDGATSVQQNPTHLYTSVGTFKVQFFVTNANGCKDSTSKTIAVIAKPTASFNLSGFNPCSSNNTITLVNTSSNATSYVWNFGDGNGTTLANPTKTYTTAGTYKITLIVSNASGCLDSTFQTITLNSKPTADFSVSSTSQCLTNNSFVFTNNSAGNIASIFWNFGDGNNSTASNPTKTYSIAGTYNVTLTVTNFTGCTDAITKVISVTSKPVINYSINNASQCILGNVFTFTNTSPIQNGVSYYWNFGDGILSSLNTISKVYTSTGTYSVSLIAINSNGCIDSLVRTVNVLAKPVASFTINNNVQCVGNNFIFTNTTGNNNATYTWRFGDGTISTSTSTTHSYSVGGNYVVTLIASNSGGCIDSASQVVSAISKPVSAFTIAVNNQCTSPNTVNFINATTGSFSSLLWTFSDGTISTDINPVKIFAKEGTYSAKLLILSSGGCRDSITKSFTILPKTVASFTLNTFSQCINNNSFSFTSTSTSGLNSLIYKWDLGDGSTASTSTVTKSYLLPGTYNVKLLVVNTSTGCRDSVNADVIVNPQPTATLSGVGTICQGNTFVINTTFTGTPPFSFTYTDGTKNYFVSGVNTYLYGLSVSPTVSSTYYIVSMNDAVCSASTAQLTSTKSVVNVDTAKFVKQPQNITSCIGNTVLFTTKVAAITNFTYQWQKNGIDIVGANSDSLKLSNISIQDSGTYRLVVILPCGSIYSNNATLKVNAIASAPIYTPTIKYCQLDTAKQLQAIGNNLTWYTVSSGGLGSAVAPVPTTYFAGTQQYWVSNNDYTNCESSRYPVTVTILPKPTVNLVALGSTDILPTQTVTLKASASSNALGIRWYYNDAAIGTLIGNQAIVGFNALGKYQAESVTADGCTALSQVLVVRGPQGLAPTTQGSNLHIYPNPATSIVNMYFDNPINEDAQVRLVNMAGQILDAKFIKFTNHYQPVQFNVSSLRADTYAIEVINSRGISIGRNLFVKAR